MIVTQFLVVVGLMCIHLFADKLRFLEGVPRSRWLSFAGGTSVAYVFLHILPELSEAHQMMNSRWQRLPFADHQAYLVGLAGIIVFYGLDKLVGFHQQRQRESRGGEGETTTGNDVFWFHILSFAIYNVFIGYLLVSRDSHSRFGLLLFGLAMGLHFLVNDFSLREDHKDTYRRLGRWVLAAAVILGWVAGLVLSLGEALTSALFAFLAGGIVLNVLKEELPESRQSSFLFFAVGAIAYSSLELSI